MELEASFFPFKVGLRKSGFVVQIIIPQAFPNIFKIQEFPKSLPDIQQVKKMCRCQPQAQRF